jgi:hypothetical protein
VYTEAIEQQQNQNPLQGSPKHVLAEKMLLSQNTALTQLGAKQHQYRPLLAC